MKRGGGGVAPPRLRAPRHIVEHARTQRKSGNLPEVVLWRALRERPGGYKFRRQHPDLPGAFDFACLGAKLVIEIDGEIHDRGVQPARDERKDEMARRLGLAVLRIPAKTILRNLESALIAIVESCKQRAAPLPPRPLHHPAAPGGPPPRAGEVLGEEVSQPFIPPRHGEGDRRSKSGGGGVGETVELKGND